MLSTFLLAWVLVDPVAAGALAPGARAEIEGLLSRLQVSACEFNRNGSWYNAAEAKAHLLRKLKYLEDRDAVESPEQFIDMAASKSSTSGKPYLVKCGSAAPVHSRSWLRSELKAMRTVQRTPVSSPR